MDIWHYHPVTREFVGHGQADPDPKNAAGWLIPAHAAAIPPKQLTAQGEASVFVFDPVGHWDTMPDHRGETWYDAYGTKQVVDFLGDPAAQGLSPDAPPPPPATAEQVKAEAYRRIVAICPEWQQRNLTAQAVVLAEKGRANWSQDELAAWEAGEALWGAIKAIREASDVIEALDPIPSDFTADEYWP